jgi:hypothetical protein
MPLNLFGALFNYRPRPDREPLEDFTTAALAYLLTHSEELREGYLDLLVGAGPARRNIRVCP